LNNFVVFSLRIREICANPSSVVDRLGLESFFSVQRCFFWSEGGDEQEEEGLGKSPLFHSHPMFNQFLFTQLRSSFSKAFSRNKKERLGSLSLSDVEDGKNESTGECEFSAPPSPMVFSKKHHSMNIGSSNNSEADEDENSPTT